LGGNHRQQAVGGPAPRRRPGPHRGDHREHLAYGWLLPDQGHDTVLTLSTVFVDLVAAGTSTATVDELARSLTT